MWVIALPEIGPKPCDIRYMKTSALLNGVKQRATESRCCQAKGCAKLGSPRFIADNVE